MILNPFGIARWALDKFAYWLLWSLLFLGLMVVFTQFGSPRWMIIAYSFVAFTITTACMDFVRERWRGRVSG